MGGHGVVGHRGRAIVMEQSDLDGDDGEEHDEEQQKDVGQAVGPTSAASACHRLGPRVGDQLLALPRLHRAAELNDGQLRAALPPPPRRRATARRLRRATSCARKGPGRRAVEHTTIEAPTDR